MGRPEDRAGFSDEVSRLAVAGLRSPARGACKLARSAMQRRRRQTCSSRTARGKCAHDLMGTNAHARMPRQRTPRQIPRAPLPLPRVMDPFAAPKRKRDSESGADVLSSTLSRLENDAASVTAAAAARPFVAAATWAGARPGYVFGRGAQGQGYYADRGGGSTSAAAPAPAAEVRRMRGARV